MKYNKIDREEERWAKTKNPGTLAELTRQRGGESKRKYRLLAAALCRLAWPQLDEAQRRAVELVERYADGLAKYTEMRAAVKDMITVGWRMQPPIVEATRRDSWSAATGTLYGLLGASWSGGGIEEFERGPHGRYWGKAEEWQQACAACCHLVKDCFADLFHPVEIAPTWRTPAVVQMAQAAYTERDSATGALDPTRLRVLADALEEAGCNNALVRGHLHDQGAHVAGCWLIDRLLEKPA